MLIGCRWEYKYVKGVLDVHVGRHEQGVTEMGLKGQESNSDRYVYFFSLLQLYFLASQTSSLPSHVSPRPLWVVYGPYRAEEDTPLSPQHIHTNTYTRDNK